MDWTICVEQFSVTRLHFTCVSFIFVCISILLFLCVRLQRYNEYELDWIPAVEPRASHRGNGNLPSSMSMQMESMSHRTCWFSHLQLRTRNNGHFSRSVHMDKQPISCFYVCLINQSANLNFLLFNNCALKCKSIMVHAPDNS